MKYFKQVALDLTIFELQGQALLSRMLSCFDEDVSADNIVQITSVKMGDISRLQRQRHLRTLVNTTGTIPRRMDIPECASKVCATSRLCRSQMYTLLSSLPDTIHFPPVTLKQAAMQYFSFLWPMYVFKHRELW